MNSIRFDSIGFEWVNSRHWVTAFEFVCLRFDEGAIVEVTFKWYHFDLGLKQ